MNKLKKKENIIIAIILVIMLIAIVGVSYAAFSFGQLGNIPNTITTGDISMTYTESDNTMSISNALPTTDKTGTTRLKEGEYFDFTVSSNITGNVNINYEISAKEVGEGTIDGSNIKLYLTEIVDGEEQDLMSPEVYNEESDTNEYTGRPANEMSLYTSSMNSSEEHHYRLRMYVTEEYNPQGDGGGLTFTVQVNVYGKAGDKYVPLTTEEILEDNELQEETTNMFNYASNGMYLSELNNGPHYSTDESQKTTGLYSMEDEDGISYYFRGNVDNNNIQFGEYTKDYYVYSDSYQDYQSKERCIEYGNEDSECSQVKLASAGDKIYWKIVRVNGDGSLRLIYNGTSTTPDNSDLAHSYIVGTTPYNLESNDPKYAGYTYDNGTDSFIKNEVDTWYANALGNTVYDKMIKGGRFCSDSSGYREDEMMGNAFASFDRLGVVVGNLIGMEMQENVTPSLVCPKTSENYGGSYRLKVGLLTSDELVLAGESLMVSSDNYLTSDFRYWTMTPAGFSDEARVGFEFLGLYGYSVNDDNSIRPVINVTSENGFTSGDGTAENPYVLS